MFYQINVLLVSTAITFCFLIGCAHKRHAITLPDAGPAVSPTSQIANEARHSQLRAVNYEDAVTTEFLVRPLTSTSELPESFHDISLDEAIAFAFQDADVLRSLAANVVQNPQSVASSLDPAIQSTDPNFGIEAALSAFDTSLTSSILYSKNDDTFNNPSTTGNAAEVQQDLTNFNLGLTKTSAAGTQFSIDNTITHDSSSNPALLFPSAWDTSWQATVRQPLLQGRGVLFNRIAGPQANVGLNGSGLLISRSNHDISIVEFERSVNAMVLEIVNAYWQLDLAYRNFETVKAARDASLKTWNIAQARKNSGLPGGEADREAQARAQYYTFEAQLMSSLNSVQGGGNPGVLQAESNMRRLLNLPQSGDELLRPIDDPPQVEQIFDWQGLVAKTLARRPEMRQQRKRIEQRSLLLLASKNFTLPRLDAIATYRNSGFGDDLIGNGDQFSGALNEAWAGNYDEWEFGFTMDVPLGFRQAQAGVRNFELQLMRERAVLAELRNQILHDLGTAIRNVDQSYDSIELAQLRNQASTELVDSRIAAYRADAIGFEDLLDAQQRLLDAELAFHTTKNDYRLAIASMYSESGTLLTEYAISLAQEPGPGSNANAEKRSNLFQRKTQNANLRQHGYLK